MTTKELKTTSGNSVMTTIGTFAAQVMKIWEDKNKIRKLFAPKLSDDEFDFFVSLGKGIGANPFTKEIWAVKYGTNAASIFCGRDFYRRKAQELEDYDGHIADTVYSNDDFSVVDGLPKHSYKLTDRGDLIGAYCVVKTKRTSQPFYVFVLFNEYDKKQSLWKDKPDTMIRKVAEAQGIRGAFQGTFAGTHDESEQWKVEEAEVEQVAPEPIEQTTDEDMQQELSDICIDLAEKEGVDPEKLCMRFSYFKKPDGKEFSKSNPFDEKLKGKWLEITLTNARAARDEACTK